MRLIRVIGLVLLCGLGACSTTAPSEPMQVGSWSPLIDQPSPPFPYNSKLCP